LFSELQALATTKEIRHIKHHFL